MERELLKKDDKVVMHTCMESEGKNYSRIWSCETDEFIKGDGVYKQNLIFLEGFSGYFATEFLQKINIPEDIDLLNLKENNRLLENGSKQLCNEIKLLIKDKDLIISSHVKYADLVDRLLEIIKHDNESKFKGLSEKIKDCSNEFNNKFIYS